MPRGDALKLAWSNSQWRERKLAEVRDPKNIAKRISYAKRSQKARAYRDTVKAQARRDNNALRQDLKRMERQHDDLLGMLDAIWVDGRQIQFKEAPTVIRGTSEALLRRRIISLEEELDAAHSEIRRLKSEYGLNRSQLYPYCRELGLSEIEGYMVHAMMIRDFATKEQIAGKMTARGRKNIAVHIWKVRKKLKPHGITIENVHSEGYKIPSASKARIRAVTGGQFLKQAAE